MDSCERLAVVFRVAHDHLPLIVEAANGGAEALARRALHINVRIGNVSKQALLMLSAWAFLGVAGLYAHVGFLCVGVVGRTYSHIRHRKGRRTSGTVAAFVGVSVS